MHIVHLLARLSHGGSERVVVELAAQHTRMGHRVSVIAAGGPLAAELNTAGAEHLDWPVQRKHPAALRQIGRLRRWLARERPDILHLHARLPAWLAWLAWRGLPPGARPALVTSVHGRYSVNPYSAVMVRGEAVIAVSEFIAGYIASAYPRVPGRRVHVIPPGLDPAVFHPDYTPEPGRLDALRREYNLPPDVPVLCLPGRLTRLKGHRHLLTLLASLNEAGIHAIGLVLGGLPQQRRRYARELRRLAQTLNVADQLRWVAPQDDVRPWFRLSTLILNLSQKPEAWGRTIPEALALGVPAVGFDHGGVGANLGRHYPAGRVPPGDMTALTETVARLLTAPPPIPKPRFPDLDQTAAAHLKVYRGLI